MCGIANERAYTHFCIIFFLLHAIFEWNHKRKKKYSRISFYLFIFTFAFTQEFMTAQNHDILVSYSYAGTIFYFNWFSRSRYSLFLHSFFRFDPNSNSQLHRRIRRNGKNTRRKTSWNQEFTWTDFDFLLFSISARIIYRLEI